jgi:hypothetical protein
LNAPSGHQQIFVSKKHVILLQTAIYAFSFQKRNGISQSARTNASNETDGMCTDQAWYRKIKPAECRLPSGSNAARFIKSKKEREREKAALLQVKYVQN